MAEAVMERTETKREKSLGQSRSIQYRSKAWDEINKNAVAAARPKFPTEEEARGDDSEDDNTSKAPKKAGDGWETDEDMDAAEAETEAASKTEAPAATRTDDLDEIL